MQHELSLFSMEDIMQSINNYSRVVTIVLITALSITMPTYFSDEAFASTKSKYGYHGKLNVRGTKIKDENGNIVRLRGMSSHGLSWYPEYVNKSNMKQMKEKWGCNVFRLAMYTAEYNGYCVGNSENREKLEDLIDQAVNDAEDLGMYIIIDWHILHDKNPNKYKYQARTFFSKVSDKYANKDNVIYEICNEPNGSTTWAQIKSYANTVIPAIRANDKDGIIIVGTPKMSQDVAKAVSSPIKGHTNIMYAFHFYAGTHKEYFRKKVESAVKSGLPVFVSEFGICDASGSGKINKTQANKWLKLMNKYDMGYCMWNFSNKNETSAIIKSKVKATGGFKSSHLTSSGKWFVSKNPYKITYIKATYKKTMKKGKKQTIKVKLHGSISDSKITYKSSNKKVLTVSKKGKIKAKKKGTAKITIKAGTKKKVVTIKVK